MVGLLHCPGRDHERGIETRTHQLVVERWAQQAELPDYRQGLRPRPWPSWDRSRRRQTRKGADAGTTLSAVAGGNISNPAPRSLDQDVEMKNTKAHAERVLASTRPPWPC